MRPRAGARPQAPARRPLKPHGIDSVMTSGHSVTEQLLGTSTGALGARGIRGKGGGAVLGANAGAEHARVLFIHVR